MNYNLLYFTCTYHIVTACLPFSTLYIKLFIIRVKYRFAEFLWRRTIQYSNNTDDRLTVIQHVNVTAKSRSRRKHSKAPGPLPFNLSQQSFSTAYWLADSPFKARWNNENNCRAYSLKDLDSTNAPTLTRTYRNSHVTFLLYHRLVLP